jgi:Mg2+/Co2+ transporter CorB
MTFLSLVVLGVLVILLLLAAGAVPRRSSLSLYELRRRQKIGSKAAADELHRLSATQDIATLLRIVEIVCVVLITLVGVWQWGFAGALVAVVIALFYRRIAKLELIRVNAQRIYDEIDAKLVVFVDRYPYIGSLLGGVADNDASSTIGSREELEHMIDESVEIVTSEEKKLLKSSLHFAEKTVESVMTPRGVLEVIDSHEILGPIVLDQLHKTGHSRFPVTKGDIDHIVGILHIRELLMLQEKTSQTAEQSMEKKVYYINQSQTLQHALAAFLSTRHHMFIVVNQYRETAGVLTLEDCIEALIGRKIIDEFDAHDDLRVVAERQARRNNNAPGSVDV